MVLLQSDSCGCDASWFFFLFFPFSTHSLYIFSFLMLALSTALWPCFVVSNFSVFIHTFFYIRHSTCPCCVSCGVNSALESLIDYHNQQANAQAIANDEGRGSCTGVSNTISPFDAHVHTHLSRCLFLFSVYLSHYPSIFPSLSAPSFCLFHAPRSMWISLSLFVHTK